MTCTPNSREKGKPLPYGPKAQRVVTGFRVTLTDEIETMVTVRFEIDRYTLFRCDHDFSRLICPRCDRELTESNEHLVRLKFEEHLVMRHGHEFPREHPFYNPSRTQELIDWLELHSIDL